MSEEGKYSDRLRVFADLLDEDFKANLKKVIDELDDIVKKIKYEHKTRGYNTPTGARHCEFDGVVEVEK